MFTNGAVLARDLDPFLFLVFPLGDCCSALPTVQAGAFGNSLEFAQEVVVWPPLFINKNPAVVRSVFPTILQRSNQRIRQWYVARFVRFQREVSIFLSANVVSFFVEINVLPSRKRNFSVPASSSEEELITNPFLFIHLGEEPFQFLIRVRDSRFVLDNGHLVPWDSCFDAILF